MTNIKCWRVFAYAEMQEVWEKEDDMQERMSQIQSDSLNKLSFPHTNNSVFIVKFMLLGTSYIFFSSYFFASSVCMVFLMYNDNWQSTRIALLHIEHTILVFQRRTLLNPFPHINLSWILSLPHAHMCLDYD